jgi:NADPH:quinone reductase
MTDMVVIAAKGGGPQSLVPERRPVPEPGPGEVLIQVAAAGLNGADLAQREGRYLMPPGAPDILGLEASGTIVAVGEGVKGWRRGDRVCALLAGGGYAEYCVAPEEQCLPIPDGLDLVEAAALPEVVLTVWANVFEHGALRAGETLLVHGGSSGIGTTAIQLGRVFGARVFATAGTDDKCRACEKLGAEKAVNYREADFVEAVNEATAGAGVDVILDMVGAAYLGRNIALLRQNGRVVHLAIKGEPRATIDLRAVQLKHLVVTGSRLRPRSVAEKGRLCRIVEEKVWPLYAAKSVVPVIDSVFPLAEASRAHERLESGVHIGKVMLTTGGA